MRDDHIVTHMLLAIILMHISDSPLLWEVLAWALFGLLVLRGLLTLFGWWARRRLRQLPHRDTK